MGTVIAVVRGLLGQERSHLIAISIDICDVVIAVARGTHTATHQLLKQDGVRIVEIEDNIDIDIELGQQLCLSNCSGHAIKQHDFYLFKLMVAGLFNNIDGCLIIYEVAFA